MGVGQGGDPAPLGLGGGPAQVSHHDLQSVSPKVLLLGKPRAQRFQSARRHQGRAWTLKVSLRVVYVDGVVDPPGFQESHFAADGLRRGPGP